MVQLESEGVLPRASVLRLAPDYSPPERSAVPHDAQRRLVARTLAGGGSVLVAGIPGVGKTHLVDDAVRHQSAFERVVTIRGAADGAREPSSSLATVVGPVEPGDLGRRRAARRLLDVLMAGRPTPALLRVEDVQLVDPVSADVVASLVRDEGVRVVATSNLRAAVESPWFGLWREGVVERVDLEALTLEETEAWLTQTLGGTVAFESVERLWHESGGNAFHLVELVRARREATALSRRDGVWLVARGDAVPPRRLVDAVEHELAVLDADGRAVLEVVSLVGAVRTSVLLDLAPHAVVGSLVRDGILTTREASGTDGEDLLVDVSQPMYAQVVRSTLSRARRREIAERFAGSDVHRSREGLVRSVSVALDVGIRVGPDQVRAAVEAAFGLRDPQAVVRVTEAALRAAVPGESTADLTLHHAEALQQLGRGVLAARDLDALIGQMDGPGAVDDSAARHGVRVAWVRAGIAHYGEGLDAGLAVLERTRRWLREHASDHVRPQLEEGIDAAALTRRGYAGHLDVLAEAEDLLASTTSPAEVLSLVCPTVLSLVHVGRADDAVELAVRFEPLAEANLDVNRRALGEIRIAGFVARLWRGDDVGHGSGVAAELVDQVDPGIAHLRRGLLAVAHGAWHRAADELRAANVRFASSDFGGIAAFTLMVEACAAVAAGESSRARELMARSERTPLRASASLEPQMRLLRVDTLAWLRDPAAREAAAEAASWARVRGAARVELEALHRAVHLSRGGARTIDDDVVDRTRALARIVHGRRARALAEHVEALLLGDDDLARSSERDLNRAGLWLPPVAPPVSLTHREREIAMLAAGGMTSRAIAHRLTISVRTVDSHLSRVFAKTGVHSREGLLVALR